MKVKYRKGFDYQLIFALLTVIATISFLEIIPAFTQPRGAGAAFIALCYAVIPVAAVVFFVYLIDRWEPEPRKMYLLAFLWGGGVSVLVAGLLSNITNNVMVIGLGFWDCNIACADQYYSSYGAPVIEESIKGIGIIIIFFAFSRYFDGPIDGIVYGALIGAGFAFSENILYFVKYYDDIADVFKVRFLDGPLNHEAWSAIFGFFIGFAAEKNNRLNLFKWFIPAFSFATLGHWFNNDALHWQGMTYEMYIYLNNIPLIAVLFAIVFYARYQERTAVCAALNEYAQAGWFTQSDVQMIETLNSRRRAQEWAEGTFRASGFPLGTGVGLMKKYQKALLTLGVTRANAKKQKIVQTSDNRRIEREMLQEVSKLREKLNTRQD